MTIYEKLSAVQTELKAPKNQVNKFGGYNYRSCEDILEAVKPILAQHKATITLHDDVIMVGERIYVRATATFYDIETGEILSAFALAREPEVQKGMTDAQLTGSTSSYARKYALNGLLLIDDTKDDDTRDNSQYVPQQKQRLVSQEQYEICRDLTDDFTILSESQVIEWVKKAYGVTAQLGCLTESQFARLKEAIQKASNK